MPKLCWNDCRKMSINKENKSVKKYQNNDEIKQTMVKRINIVMKMKYD